MFHLRHRCSPRSDITRARIVDVLRLVAPQLSGGCNSLGYVVRYYRCIACRRLCQCPVLSRRGNGCTGREYKGERCSIFYLWRRIRPRGERTTCTLSSMTCCRYPSESECPAWDAWANPVAEANDPSSLVSEYAACGVWRPHTVLPFSRMSLVAYLRGWVSGY